MQRKNFIKKLGIAGGLLLLSKYESFASIVQQAGYEVKMLTKDVGIFNEKGGTIVFYLGNKGVTIVDTQFPDSVANLIKDLKEKGKTTFQLLINTHHHGDHTSGNIVFKDLVKTVVAHKNSLENQKANALKQKSEEKQLYPTQTFETTWSKKIGKEKVQLHYFGAGHTNGDTIVEFKKAKVVHCGDLVFNRRFPYIDKAGGANIKSWITVLQKINEKFSDDTQFVFGHANDKYSVVGTKADIKAFENYLTQLLAFVQNAVKEGKTKEEILKTKIIPGNTEWTGDGVERGISAAYTEIVEGK